MASNISLSVESLSKYFAHRYKSRELSVSRRDVQMETSNLLHHNNILTVDACTEDQLKSSLQCSFITRFLHTNSSVNYVQELWFVDGYLKDMFEFYNNISKRTYVGLRTTIHEAS